MSRKFNGSNQRIEQTAFSLGTTYTVMAWVKPDSVSGIEVILGHRATGNAIFFQLDRNGSQARFIVRDDAGNIAVATKNSSYAVGVGVCVMGIREGGTCNVYADNSQGTTDTDTFGTITTDHFDIATFVDHTNVFNGQIAFVVVWDGIALTSDERQAIVNGANPFLIRNESIVFFNTLEGNNSPEPDWSGNGYNGTLINSPTKGDWNPPVEPMGNYL